MTICLGMGSAGLANMGVRSLAAQIKSLFNNGEQGAWYEPSLTNATLFQDSAGTTPVTAVGQPVGKMLDRSGRGNHATQPTSVNRPVLQQDAGGRFYLAFNGTNSWMSTGSIDFSAGDKMTVVAGVRKLSDVGGQMFFEFSPNLNNSMGTFAMQAGSIATAAGAFWSPGVKGGASAVAVQVASVAAPASSVLGAAYAIKTTPRSALRINGAPPVASVASADVGNFSNQPLYIGARAGSSLFFNGDLYSLIIRGALSSDSQILALERFANQRTGAY